MLTWVFDLSYQTIQAFLYVEVKDGYYTVGIAVLKNGPWMVELNDATSAVEAAVVTLTVGALSHFDEVIVVAEYCSRGWGDPHELSQHD